MGFYHSHALFCIGFASTVTTFAYSQDAISVEPLAARRASESQTLFQELLPEQTGLTAVNSYEDPRMWGDRYQEMVFGTIGTGVAVADYDNDGLPDIFFPLKTGGSKLYRNLGDMRFEDVTEQAGLVAAESGWTDRFKGLFSGDESDEDLPWDQGAAFADINNDGWLDLYVTSFDAPNRLYVNQGDGTFEEEAEERGLNIKDGSGSAAFCDFDRDGWLDLYLQTNMLNVAEKPEGQPDYLFRNTGDGKFTDVTKATGISGATSGHSVTWWDYNEDGWPDLYVANDFSVPDKLYQNLHDGTFTDVLQETVPHMPYYSMGADIGDVNNDNRIDFFVGDMAPTLHERDHRGMAISRARELKKGSNAQSPQRMRNTLYLNTGLEVMTEGAWMHGIANSDWTWSTRFEDLDNDGFVDLHVTNGMIREYHNTDILQRIMGALNRNAQRMVMYRSSTMEESNLAFKNLQGEGFQRAEEDWGLDHVGVSFGSAFADFDRDGDLDLVYANYDAAPSVFRNEGQEGNRAIFELRGSTSNRFGIGARVEIESVSTHQVREMVNARGYLSSSEPILHFGLGKDESINRATIRWPSGQVQTFEDLPANSRFTITEPTGNIILPTVNAPKPRLFQEATDELGITFEESDFPKEKPVFQPLAPFSLSRNGPAITTGDLDGDSVDDLVIGASSSVPAQLLLGTADGSSYLSKTKIAGTESYDGNALIADFDGDGEKDLLLTRASPGRVTDEMEPSARLLTNDGSGRLQLASETTIPPLPSSVGSASYSDFNDDGLPDLFIGSRTVPQKYPSSGRSILLANDGGKFADVTGDLLASDGDLGLVTGSVWADIDGDDWTDLIVTTEWGQVRAFRNINGERFEEATKELGFSAAGNGLWSCVATGDFNGDSKPDFVVGNLGLNTRYRAEPSAPAIMYYGSFGGRTSDQLVEAYYENGRLLPWRSRPELIEAIPPLERRFQKTNDFAKASLEEIFGEQALERALKREATNLRSGALLSQENGTYSFEPLPWTAQNSPIQGLAVGDFNGDGLTDISATQNRYDIDPTVGRFDGGLGLLLLGDGSGKFEAADPADSGLMIKGEGRGILATDFDGDGRTDIISSRAGDSPIFFENRSK